jgi:hypothetical protein
MLKPSPNLASLNYLVVLQLSAARSAPMRRTAALAIANRLGANQALGDMIKHSARIQSLG